MYKAIKEIGDYKVGENVPDSKAELWLEMYVEPHVEKVEEVSDVVVPKVNIVQPANKPEGNMLDDYLGRNQSVVKKNILKDNLSEYQLKELLKLEKFDKNRPLVIESIIKKLKE